MRSLILTTLLLVGVTVSADEDKTYSGLFTITDGVQTFQPCGGDVNWVDATKWVRKPLNTIYKDQSTDNNPIYITLRGHFHDEVLNGAESKYSGIFHISEVYLYSSVVPDTCKTNEK